MDNLDAQYDHVRDLVKAALDSLDHLPTCDRTNGLARRAAQQLKHAENNLWEVVIALRYQRGKDARPAPAKEPK
jgi:hypothetical protein